MNRLPGTTRSVPGPGRAQFSSFVEAIIAQIHANKRTGIDNHPGISTLTNPYAFLRSMAFSKTRAQVGIAAPDTNAPAWGIIMEMVAGNVAPLTLMSLADGTTSMYLGTGAAVIGGHSHEHVRQAAALFLGQANALRSTFEPTEAAAPPVPGRVAFYARTDGGLLKADAPEPELTAGIHSLSPLYFAAHNVIAELRKTSETPNGATG